MGHDRGFGGGGGRERHFDNGELRFVILQLIADKPSYGYEIIKAIEEQVAGAYSPSPGVIYPTLTLLEELGYVTISAGEGGKKLHEITPQGRAFLDANRPALEAILARMAEASRARVDGPAPQILRAIQAAAGENPELTLDGILLTMYDPSSAACVRVAEYVRTHLSPSLVFGTMIPRTPASIFSLGG